MDSSGQYRSMFLERSMASYKSYVTGAVNKVADRMVVNKPGLLRYVYIS
jgi:hypothetical protein